MIRRWFFFLVLVVSLVGTSSAKDPPSSDGQAVLQQFVKSHCLDCHDATERTGGLALDAILRDGIERHPQEWEKVVRKLSSRQMPPRDVPRPDEASYESVLGWLTSQLDSKARRDPFPGHTDSFRRLSRTEYANAIRDLLAVEMDVENLLPADESSQGFDNTTATGLSPVLLNRYISAAQKISRLAVGASAHGLASDTFRARADITQDNHRMDGLPLGTRGGMNIAYHFPQDGEYDVQVWLMRDRNDELEGLTGSHELEVLLDRARMASFTIKRPPSGQSDRSVEAQLRARIRVSAGPHDVGVTFVAKPFSVLETERQPLNVHYNFYRHPRLGPAVYQVSIAGPITASGPGDTPSRRLIFTCQPRGTEDEEECAERIVGNLLRRAYRRPVDEQDLKAPMEFFRRGRESGGFEAGIEHALAAILVNPQFLFRIERDPGNVPPSRVFRISDVELASRLSFFLWSSIPDDELLDLAARAELSRPEIIEQQVRRMLADERSRSLVSNFAEQWLHLRNLDAIAPDGRLFPDFDHNLREAFRRETVLLFQDICREDRSLLTLLDSPFTYLNERLARHYGIPHVHGSHFRRVMLDDETRRGGILRHGSILTVTSYATRTSPVIRGKWVLENILGTPPPPPPPNVPALADNTVSASLPLRQRLAVHRANAACAACHDLIDPVGFALENFDALGRWRDIEHEQLVDASGILPGSSEFVGVTGLEQALLERPELFVRTLTEKLMTFALGRGVEYYDAPSVRSILREAREDNYRFSALILGIVNSVPFQMRAAQGGEGGQAGS